MFKDRRIHDEFIFTIKTFVNWDPFISGNCRNEPNFQYTCTKNYTNWDFYFSFFFLWRQEMINSQMIKLYQIVLQETEFIIFLTSEISFKYRYSKAWYLCRPTIHMNINFQDLSIIYSFYSGFNRFVRFRFDVTSNDQETRQRARPIEHENRVYARSYLRRRKSLWRNLHCIRFPRSERNDRAFINAGTSIPNIRYRLVSAVYI